MSISGNEIKVIVLWQTILYLAFALVSGCLWWRKHRRLPFDRNTINLKAAHMPLDYLKPERRKIKELPVGETAYIDCTDIAVDLRGTSFIEQDARMYEEASWHTAQVRRVPDGYILTLPKKQTVTFTPRRLYSFCDYLPVIEILEETPKI